MAIGPETFVVQKKLRIAMAIGQCDLSFKKDSV